MDNLREKIAYWFYVEQAKSEHMTKWCSWEEVKSLTPKTAQSLLELADQILAIIKEAGYQTHEEVQDLVDMAIKRARLGHMKLADDQSLPLVDPGSAGGYSLISFGKECQQDMLLAGWRKVEVKE